VPEYIQSLECVAGQQRQDISTQTFCKFKASLLLQETLRLAHTAHNVQGKKMGKNRYNKTVPCKVPVCKNLVETRSTVMHYYPVLPIETHSCACIAARRGGWIGKAITWGSVGCDSMEQTVSSCPDRTWACTLERMSHTRHTLSRPPVISRSRVGWSAREYTPLR